MDLWMISLRNKFIIQRRYCGRIIRKYRNNSNDEVDECVEKRKEWEDDMYYLVIRNDSYYNFFHVEVM